VVSAAVTTGATGVVTTGVTTGATAGTAQPSPSPPFTVIGPVIVVGWTVQKYIRQEGVLTVVATVNALGAPAIPGNNVPSKSRIDIGCPIQLLPKWKWIISPATIEIALLSIPLIV